MEKKQDEKIERLMVIFSLIGLLILFFQFNIYILLFISICTMIGLIFRPLDQRSIYSEV